MNIAVLFAGGKGTRMENATIPKQFMEIYGIPIIIRTCKAFQSNNNIDKIVIVTLNDWIDYTKELLKKYNITKAEHVVPGGSSGQLSIFEGLKCAIENYGENNIVILNDGVRPFIDSNLINGSIENVKKYGSSVSIVKATETISIVNDENEVLDIPNRDYCVFIKAPQCFYLKEIYNNHLKAISEGKTSFIDSASLMSHYGTKLHTIETNYNNIKITTVKDIKIAESIFEMRLFDEN
ncbi:MAG: IspD/TarI family cytidylyltransferase [Candidatus Coprovivens sp.]